MTITPFKKSPKVFPYKQLSIGLILAKTLFETYLCSRQYKRLSEDRPLPTELKGLEISVDEYQKSKEYSRAKMKFEVVHTIYSVLIDIALIVYNYWVFLWHYSGYILQELHFDTENEYYRAIVFITLELIRDRIFNILFEIYESFVLEEKFGFNKKTVTLFIRDEIVTFLLKLFLIPLVLVLILWAIDKGGEFFYIYVEIVAIVLTFVGMWLYPNVIAPLFNKFTDLEDGPLKVALYKLANSLNYPLKKIYVVDASTRTSHSNAYLFGFGKNKRIVLFDTLLKQLDPPQIEAVLCHELGHWMKSHSIKGLLMAYAQIFTLFYLYGFFMNEDGIFQSFGFVDKSIFIGLALFSQIYSPLSYLLDIISLKVIRTHEFQADRFAFEMGRAEELKEGLKKLFKENKSDMDPDPIYSAFKHSHPTMLERLRYLDSLQDQAKGKKQN